MEKSGSYLSNKERFKPHRNFDFPQEYGDNKITVMAKDSRALYVYWEIKREVEDSVRKRIEKDGRVVSKKALRVYEITAANPVHDPKMAFDFEVKDDVSNWHVDVNEEGKEWMAMVGMVCETGEFLSLAQSNVVKTPVDAMSKVSDKKWPCSKGLYDKMIAVAGGHETGQSSY